jgi:hypothetical protein
MILHTDPKRALVVYGNVQIEGPDDDVNWILSLIREAEAKQVRRSASLSLPQREVRAN